MKSRQMAGADIAVAGTDADGGQLSASLSQCGPPSTALPKLIAEGQFLIKSIVTG